MLLDADKEDVRRQGNNSRHLRSATRMQYLAAEDIRAADAGQAARNRTGETGGVALRQNLDEVALRVRHWRCRESAVGFRENCSVSTWIRQFKHAVHGPHNIRTS